MQKQCGAGAVWRQPDLAFTMSGLIGEIGGEFAKGKSKAASSPNWNRTNHRRHLRSIGAISRASTPPDPPAPRNCALFPNWHGLCKPSASSTTNVPAQTESEPMKTLYCLCAALVLSLSLMAATVVVPLGATQIIA
jgi:hypothetical protein